ncbi:MAG: hypothetical protein OXE99_03765 [Cellvibrionales bacterium]|nr:hypothetical protein [Cellvibrionales bacterium]
MLVNKSTIKSLVGCSALLGTLAIGLSPEIGQAGAKISIDEETFVTLGAGLRTGFTLTEDAAPDGKSYKKDFSVQNVRLYIGGQLTDDWKFTVNTEEIFGEYGVLDAMIQYEPSPYFNVWAGRVLTPADRIEMNGPFYALTWNQYTIPFYASDNDPQGRAGLYNRDDGVVVWGAVDKFQYALGVFEGLSTEVNTTDSLLYAMRFAYNFLNKEQNPGYYTSSTYYGGLGDILTLGFALQAQKDGVGSTAKNAEDFLGYSVDLLFEKVLGKSVVTFEGEYKVFDNDYVVADGDIDPFTLYDGTAMFTSLAFLLPEKTGPGKFQPYLRYTQNTPDEGDSSSLSELGVNYVINGHKLRLNANVTSGDASFTGTKADESITTASFGVQYQI